MTSDNLDLVDPERFTHWANQHLPELGTGELVIKALAGGATNAVYRVSRGEQTAVLRRPPRIPRPDSEKILNREARVQTALGGTDVLAPRVLATCNDKDVIGTDFYVMTNIDGWVPMEEKDFPAGYEPGTDARRNMAFELVNGIATLANVDYKEVGLEGFGKPEGFLNRQVDRWLGQLDSYKQTENYAGRKLPGLEYTADWLRANTPETARVGILHGDYAFANVLFAHGGTPKLAAMIDWELSTVGDVLLDLGWVAYAFRERDGTLPAQDVYNTASYPCREDLIEYYADRTGLPVDNIDYYLILAQFKLGALLERKYAEYLGGKQSKEYGEYFGELTLDLFKTAEEMARKSKL
jgi:aminoglycoside phosphotransferase (APT) family kinase protein